MDEDGNIDIRLCSAGGDSGVNRRCCNTGMLDDPRRDDYELGNVDHFGPRLIGNCLGFESVDGIRGEVGLSFKLS